MINILNRILNAFGINLPKFFISFYDLPRYFLNYFKLIKTRNFNKEFKIKFSYPSLGDIYYPSGTTKSHYFIQDLFVARKIYEANPNSHYDVGSRIDGFVAHIATFMNINVMDIRSLKNTVDGITFIQNDITIANNNLKNSIESISALHVIEHIGLGRYGDQIDFNGHLKALENISDMVKVGGIFYFSVPIGPQRIEYNAHRVFSINYLVEILLPNWVIKEFSYIDDNGILHKSFDYVNNQCNCNYGCGIFVLEKRSDIDNNL